MKEEGLRTRGEEDGYAKRFECRPEFIFNTFVKRVVDANVPEKRVKGFITARVEDVFSSNNETFLVFGKPNTALVIPKSDRTGYQKFAAYSVWRQAAHIQEITRNSGSIMQSGIWLRLLDMTPRMETQLREGMEAFQGRKFRTCVHGNMAVMHFAGFTSGSKRISKITWPYQLMRTLLENGLVFEGRPVRFEVVRTTRLSMEAYTRRIIWAELTAPWRHYKQNPVAAKIGQFLEIPGSESSHIPNHYEVAPSQPSDRAYMKGIHVRVTSDSAPGKVLRQMWGPHALFESLVYRVNIDDYFTKALRPFPQKRPSWGTILKKRIIFSPIVIWCLRKIMGTGTFREIGECSERDVYDMLRTDSVASPNKYNMVIVRMPATGETSNPTIRFIIARITVRSKIVDWVLSKHVLMSGYLWAPPLDGQTLNKSKPCVVWAGECWKTPEGKIKLDGNSGTYQPSKEEDTAMVRMCQAVFPHLEVEGKLS